MARYPVSDHCDGRRFLDPTRATDKSFRQVLGFFLSRGWARWPKALENGSPALPTMPGPGAVTATFIGHSTMLVQVDGVAFLTDPVFSSHAGPFGLLGPKRVRPPGLPLDLLPPLDFVLVSHGHYDHLDLPSLRALKKAGVKRFIAGLGNKPFLERRRVLPVTELDWWESIEISDARITFVPAQHWSNRATYDWNWTLWGGFIVETPGATVYFAGDSGYCPIFREIAARFPQIDLALIPIGAYEPRWFMAPQHMNPEEAVKAHRDLGAAVSIGIHFGTFRLTPEPIDAPIKALAAAVEKLGVDPQAFRVIECGETLTVDARFGRSANARSARPRTRQGGAAVASELPALKVESGAAF